MTMRTTPSQSVWTGHDPLWRDTPSGQPSAEGAEVASLLRRGGALLVDGVLWLGLFVAAALLVGERSAGVTAVGGAANAGISFSLSDGQFRIVTLIWFAYLAAAEAAFGVTLGKRALGIRVRRHDRSPVGVLEAVARQSTHALPLLALASPLVLAVYPVGALVARLSERRQRLGDRLAATVVVRRPSAP